MRPNKWLVAFAGTAIMVAIIFRVPQVKRIVVGE